MEGTIIYKRQSYWCIHYQDLLRMTDIKDTEMKETQNTSFIHYLLHYGADGVEMGRNDPE